MVAFHLPGGIPVYTFSIMIALGVFCGLALVAWRAPQKEVLHRVDAGLWTLFGGLLGGRVAYAAVNWPYFQNHPWEILQVNQGGLAWPGALAGGLLFLTAYAWLARRPLGSLANALVPLLAVLAVCMWLGCWLDGCAYGQSSSANWAVPARDEWGTLAPRWPNQLVGALLTIALFWLLDILEINKKYRPGTLAGLGLLGLSLLLLGSSLLRADPAPLWRGLRLDTWASLGFAGLAFLVLSVILGLRKNKDRKVPL